jgi:L-lactate dehydrogenase complex protein LldG
MAPPNFPAEGGLRVNSREAILARIRDALRTPAPRPGVTQAAPGPVRAAAERAREHLPPAGDSFAEWLALFAKNSEDLRTQFVDAADTAEAHAVMRNLGDIGEWKQVAVHQGSLSSPAAAATGAEVLTLSEGYDVNGLERCDAGITECDALIAQTGSVLLTARSGGGRALSVLPPHHVVLARRAQLVPDLPAAYALLHGKYGPANWPSLITLITGPSRTGDIERILVLGAHGPKRLTVLLLPDSV